MLHHEESELEEMKSIPTEGCHSVMCLSHSSMKRAYVWRGTNMDIGAQADEEYAYAMR